MQRLAKIITKSFAKDQLKKKTIDAFLQKQKSFLDQKVDLSTEILSLLTGEQRHMILGILRLKEITVDQIKTPFNRIISIAHDTTLQNAIQIIKKSGYSRLPVFEEKEGRKKFLKVLYAKDLLPAAIDQTKKFKITEYTKNTLVAPGSQSILSLLNEMRQKSHHLAMIVNEHGDISGLVTLEDILETIVGDIRDEFDSKDAQIKIIGEKTYLVDGNTSLAEINRNFDFTLPEEKFNTLAGYIMHELKGVVGEGSRIDSNLYTLFVEKTSGRQIVSVRILLKEISSSESNHSKQEKN